MRSIINKLDRAALFRTRLAEAMEQTGTSRAALARSAGVDRSTVTQLLSEADARMPGGHLVAACAETLSVSTDWLLGLSDRPEASADLLTATLTEAERATSADDQIFAWHQEAAGYKIRHVPATLPDMLKTRAVMEWEYADTMNRSPGQAIAVAEARLDWMRASESDYEIALPLHEMRSFAEGTGYYMDLPAGVRREQIDWILSVHDQLYPTLRLFLYDAARVYSAPITIFGPKLAAIYLGRYYVAFRDRDRVRALTRHFDWLVREASHTARDLTPVLSDLRDRMT
ncbi:helix-turn-helix domain-containing protein [Nioella sediminis]|jgi:transcriptional regulator with XRE-family HTH domain|uniref:helix-turn-helix domain-containing protein n=1 Tax=Nioella sediminis TaxID=1912092 RepID=UPI0008FCE3B5|nr:helix-turn-helix transcriptional regulator [Nioella sediminis]TBX29277.1 DNA-binding protein [Roseovarius sp. JS7-11]